VPAPAVVGLKELPVTPGPDQIPVIPLWVVLSAVDAAEMQKGPMEVRVGVILVLTITIMVLLMAHWPTFGVKVSVWLPIPAVAGLKELPATPGPDQFPVMPLCVVFKAVDAAEMQKGPMGVRVGITGAFTVTIIVAGLAHWSAFGVKVSM
jgi:hypothetical protein